MTRKVITREVAGHYTAIHELEEALRSVSHHTEQDFLGNGVWGPAGPFTQPEAQRLVVW